MHIALVGNPNSGKSSVLNSLTGSNVFTSNYPGTSMEVVSSVLELPGSNITFYDTPGIYSIYSDNQESAVCRELLEKLHLELIIHLIDASNLERNLDLTAELLELNIPLLILINQIDRARALGISINTSKLENLTGTPVVLFSAESGEGIIKVHFLLERLLKGLPLLECNQAEKTQSQELLCHSCNQDCSRCGLMVENHTTADDISRANWAQKTAAQVSSDIHFSQQRRLDSVERFLDRPVAGTIVLLLLLYIGFFLLLKFINFSEGWVSGFLQPFAEYLKKEILALLPGGFMSSVLSQAIPEGLIIPLTIIMPAMLMVSFLMAILEDSGLLPRYSVSLERVGRLFGVSGQAVIPISLGFGCRTPAILATRILNSEAQRFITISLLSIVVPCAATVGIMAMVIAHFHASLAVLVLSMIAVLLALGSILKRLMPVGDNFIFELPPIRVPAAKNIWNKIVLRFSGFFTEVLPLILFMSVGVRILIESGVFERLNQIDSLTRLLFGIPAQAFGAVLITVFQRYLAPLVLLNLTLSPREATIAISMVALSLPCLPAMVMTVREMGIKSLLKILAMGFITSISVGIILNLILPR
ncbi:MAG: FeoB small GTPase domain-containing protein [Syntrophomonas sp.]